MTKVKFVRFFADEWIAGTAALSAVERGIYITACAFIYSSGGPVAKADLAKVCGCTKRTFDRVIGRLIAIGKLTERDSKIDSKRCENELEIARNRSETAAKNGEKGGRPPNVINEVAKPDGSLLRQEKIREDKKEESDSSASPSLMRREREFVSEFEEIWKLAPKKRDKQHAFKAFVAARRSASFEQIRDGIIRHRAEISAASLEAKYVPYPATWLNGHRWLDEQGLNLVVNNVPERKGPQSPPSEALLNGHYAAD